MAIADDFTISAAGDIRHSANNNHYTVLELHRWLQQLADDDAPATSDDILDITSNTPSERSTDQIITLNSPYNIDDDAAKYFYGGSITQDSGHTIYSGLRVLGAVNNSSTQLQIIQDNELYDGDSPFWGNQSGGGYNGNATAGVLMRLLIKSRVNNCDIDGKRIKVTARHWGDSYDFFSVTLGQGESVAAIGTTPDAQNDTNRVTVSGYTHVTNTEGYQLIDIGDGEGNQPYYSKWTYGLDTSGDGMKGVWEYIKDLTGIGSYKTIHGTDGELFFGPTHSFAYNNESGGPFTEDETLVWGTDITYSGLTGGNFTPGNYVTVGVSGVAGKVVYDDGVDQLTASLEDTSITINDSDIITEYNKDAAATGVTAGTDVTVSGNDKDGGEGLLLALDDNGAAGNLFIQLRSGSAPVNGLPVRGISSSASCLVNGSATARTVPKVFLGSYTGSLIGAYGIGIDEDDLTANDSVQDLDGDTNNPPNNVIFTVQGLVNGEDYVLVGPKAAGNNFNFSQLELATTLDSDTETAVVVTTAIPSDTPSSGTIRVELDDGRYRRVAYTAWTGSTFTIASSDWQDPDDATSGNNVMITYIDTLASATSESFTCVYSSPRNLWIRVRDGGNTPIKTFETQGTLGTAGGSSVASRISDE